MRGEFGIEHGEKFQIGEVKVAFAPFAEGPACQVCHVIVGPSNGPWGKGGALGGSVADGKGSEQPLANQ